MYSIALEAPPGVRRSTVDESLRRQVRQALACSGYGALQALGCDVVSGTVILSGRLPSYYLKQLAQAIVLREPEVRRLANLVVVEPPIERERSDRPFHSVSVVHPHLARRYA